MESAEKRNKYRYIVSQILIKDTCLKCTLDSLTQNKMSNRTTCNFSTSDRDCLPKFQDLKVKDFPTWKNRQSLDKVKYLHTFCYLCNYVNEHFVNGSF